MHALKNNNRQNSTRQPTVNRTFFSKNHKNDPGSFLMFSFQVNTFLPVSKQFCSELLMHIYLVVQLSDFLFGQLGLEFGSNAVITNGRVRICSPHFVSVHVQASSMFNIAGPSQGNEEEGCDRLGSMLLQIKPVILLVGGSLTDHMLNKENRNIF